MNFTMPRYADANDIVDRALRTNDRDVPVSMANLMPTLRWNLSALELSDRVLIELITQRAAELGVQVVD